MEKIIKKLQDDKHYYGEFGKQFLSNSDIYDLIHNPQDFQQPKEPNVNFEFGKAFHEMIMFGNVPQYVEASSRRTKLYRSACEENELDIMLLDGEVQDITNAVTKAKDNEFVAKLLARADLEFEVPNVAVLTANQIQWKCKADIVTKDCVYDIKTTSNLKGFRNSFFAYNYDSQAYIYATIFQKPMRFLVFDKKTGTTGLFDVSDDSYVKGQEKVEQAEDNYKKYYLDKTNHVKDFMVYGEL
tara:strand:- start:454 stop:1179 length:726 start_codon:yes stop_codon:yes gene_type:complete